MNKCKVLFFAANPIGMNELALDEESREIETKIRSSEHRDSLELVTKWAVRPDDLLQNLNQHRPRVSDVISFRNVSSAGKSGYCRVTISLARQRREPFRDSLVIFRARRPCSEPLVNFPKSVARNAARNSTTSSFWVSAFCGSVTRISFSRTGIVLSRTFFTKPASRVKQRSKVSRAIRKSLSLSRP